MSTFEELYRGTATHQRALELLLVAHLANDRHCMDGRYAPTVSKMCRRVVRLLREMPTSVPFDVECVLAYADYQYTEPTGCDPPLDRMPAKLPDDLLLGIGDLVDDAAALTSRDLSLLSRDDLLDSLGSRPINRHNKTRLKRSA